jgi:hypothetical protein
MGTSSVLFPRAGSRPIVSLPASLLEQATRLTGPRAVGVPRQIEGEIGPGAGEIAFLGATGGATEQSPRRRVVGGALEHQIEVGAGCRQVALREAQLTTQNAQLAGARHLVEGKRFERGERLGSAAEGAQGIDARDPSLGGQGAAGKQRLVLGEQGQGAFGIVLGV